MKKTEAVPGGICVSTQGRDEGRYLSLIHI